MIAEANVFLCRYKDKRFNVYYDIDYGPEIKAVSSISEEELKMIEELIVTEVKGIYKPLNNPKNDPKLLLPSIQ